jgi:hypothetical protein
VSDVNAATGVEKFEAINPLPFAQPKPVAEHRIKQPSSIPQFTGDIFDQQGIDQRQRTSKLQKITTVRRQSALAAHGATALEVDVRRRPLWLRSDDDKRNEAHRVTTNAPVEKIESAHQGDLIAGIK